MRPQDADTQNNLWRIVARLPTLTERSADCPQFPPADQEPPHGQDAVTRKTPPSCMEAARPHDDAASVSASLGERHLLQIHQVLATICEGSPKLRRSNGEWGRTPASAATVDAKEKAPTGTLAGLACAADCLTALHVRGAPGRDRTGTPF